MVYTLDIFQKWVADFQTWDALKAHLQSKEGGSLRVIEPPSSPYAMVRYVKGQSTMESDAVAWCRSVVVDKESRRVMSVSPRKSVPFSQQAVEADGSNWVVEEFMDGTMLNIFHNVATDDIQLATRSRLGAKNRFYRDGPTFAEMFQDAVKASGLLGEKELLGTIPTSSSVVARFTSVVVQHPQNRVVQAVEAPTLYVIHQGVVTEDGTVSIEESFDTFGLTEAVAVQEYDLQEVRAVPTIEQWVAEQSKARGYGWQGIVLKNTSTGARMPVRSPVYETVRKLRGNESSVEDRFARLRKARAIDQYLSFFAEDRKTLYELEGRLRANTRTLYRKYVDTFITRMQPYHELLWPYKHHVSVLHNLYKDMLKPHGKKIDMEEVVHYVNRLNVEDTANMLRPATAKKSETLSKAEPVEEVKESENVA